MLVNLPAHPSSIHAYSRSTGRTIDDSEEQLVQHPAPYLCVAWAKVGRPVPFEIRAGHFLPTAWVDLAPGFSSIAVSCAAVVGLVEEGEREFAVTLESRAAIGSGADRVLAGKDAIGVLKAPILFGRCVPRVAIAR